MELFQDIQELFRLPEQGFDVSVTQKQLQEEHDKQHNMYVLNLISSFLPYFERNVFEVGIAHICAVKIYIVWHRFYDMNFWEPTESLRADCFIFSNLICC